MMKMVISSLLLALSFSCSTNDNVAFITTKGNREDLKINMELKYDNSIFYLKETTFDRSGKHVITDTLKISETGVFKTNKNKLYCNNKDDSLCIMSLHNINYSFYCEYGAEYDIYISKIDSLTYISVENIYSGKGYQTILYYDNNFNIMKIEKIYGDREFEFENKNYNIKSIGWPKSKFYVESKKNPIILSIDKL